MNELWEMPIEELDEIVWKIINEVFAGTDITLDDRPSYRERIGEPFYRMYGISFRDYKRVLILIERTFINDFLPQRHPNNHRQACKETIRKRITDQFNQAKGNLPKILQINVTTQD